MFLYIMTRCIELLLLEVRRCFGPGGSWLLFKQRIPMDGLRR
jgi:hypothetical protein